MEHGDQGRRIIKALLKEEGRDLDQDHLDFMISLIFRGMGSQNQSLPCIPQGTGRGWKGQSSNEKDTEMQGKPRQEGGDFERASAKQREDGTVIWTQVQNWTDEESWAEKVNQTW